MSFFFLSFCLFYYSVFICLFVILSLFVLLSSSVLPSCKYNSNIENQKGINYLSINTLLACKRCPLSPLLTPFWSPIKHLFFIVFVTDWITDCCKIVSYTVFAFILGVFLDFVWIFFTKHSVFYSLQMDSDFMSAGGY